MGISYIKHKDIDFARWDTLVAEAANALIYAESWFLEITTKGCWDALILGDYEAVMPLPFNRKLLGYYQLYQPFFTQQLGVFSKNNHIDVQPFIDHLPSKFKRQHYSFNWNNSSTSLSTKTNLVIDLNRPYNEIEAGFSTSLRKRIIKLDHMTLSEAGDVETLVDFYREALEQKVKLGPDGYALGYDVFTAAMDNKSAKLYLLKDGDTIVARGIFFHKHSRLINVFAASDPNSKNAMSVFLAKIMEANSATKFLFDFEGSEISGIQQYFKSFGAIEQNYPILRSNQLPFWLKLIRPN